MSTPEHAGEHIERLMREGKYKEAKDFCKGAMVVFSFFGVAFLGIGIAIVGPLNGNLFDRYVMAPLAVLCGIVMFWAVRQAYRFHQVVNRRSRKAASA